MTDLFIRTLSQGLQAFVPVAFLVAWARRSDNNELATGARWFTLMLWGEGAAPLPARAQNLPVRRLVFGACTSRRLPRPS